MLEISRSIYIDAPLEDVWAVTALDFGGIYKWQTGVNHSTSEGTGPEGAPCAERVCQVNLKGFSKTKEKFLEFDEANHRFKYAVAQGLPPIVKNATNEWTHVREGNGMRITMRALIEVPGIMGWIMKGPMKKQMGSLLGEAVEELKHYVEEGKPHPRKVAAMQKYEKEMAK